MCDPGVVFAADNVNAESAVEDKNEDANSTVKTIPVIAIVPIPISSLLCGNCIELHLSLNNFHMDWEITYFVPTGCLMNVKNSRRLRRESRRNHPRMAAMSVAPR